MVRFLQYRLSPYRRMASPAKKTAEEREDTDYDHGTSGSEAGTPKKGRKKKETPDPGLTLGTDIEDHLKPDRRQVEVELDNVRIDQEKTKGQIRRKDTKLLQKRIECLEAAPRTGPLHVVLWEDNSMLPTGCSLFLLREPSRIDVSHVCRWRLLVCICGSQTVVDNMFDVLETETERRLNEDFNAPRMANMLRVPIFSWPVKPKPPGDPTTFDFCWLLIWSPYSWSRKV